ncbi:MULTISPECIES: hypothetical protein [unclassified Agarivorans]|uniref:hypothetical protein n=1 Tax=unclassified Agarivorans TaxID=2636026 RepID=UPI0026E465E0|nr:MULTISPECIES: hypothetical protein [unclassified Agarivorans]MDO6687607.1 hypothetical protein [Agarivorans sp. 3_MG-2023]MDO6717060.1 hypothetical protein [Agarivorans sp. 2_MG-2023]
MSDAQQDQRGLFQGKNTWFAGIMPISTLVTNKAPINSLNSQQLCKRIKTVAAPLPYQ